MKIIDKRLIETANFINSKFSEIQAHNRAEVSTQILPHLRHFCEVFMYKVYDEENVADLYQTQDNLTLVRKYFKANHYDIYKFHCLLDASVGHIDFGPMQSEALMLKYIPKLIELKVFLFQKYNINLLDNITKYPLDLDESLSLFYEKILEALCDAKCATHLFTRNQYFVRKRSMKYINGYVFYEYVFDVSDDKTNKYNTFVCYSFKNIKFDYDVNLLLETKQIQFLNTNIPIKIIYDYKYSVRPCTFQNLLYLINGDSVKCQRDKEYHSLMEIIKNSDMSLVDIICSEPKTTLATNGYYAKFIKFVRDFIKQNQLGSNTIRFLLCEMRNSVINAQKYRSKRNDNATNDLFNN